MMFNLKSSDSHRKHKGSKCAEAALQALSVTPGTVQRLKFYKPWCSCLNKDARNLSDCTGNCCPHSVRGTWSHSYGSITKARNEKSTVQFIPSACEHKVEPSEGQPGALGPQRAPAPSAPGAEAGCERHFSHQHCCTARGGGTPPKQGHCPAHSSPCWEEMEVKITPPHY